MSAGVLVPRKAFKPSAAELSPVWLKTAQFESPLGRERGKCNGVLVGRFSPVKLLNAPEEGDASLILFATVILLTMCRKGELLQATWKQVDFEAATWTVPAEKMKARRAHVVYLSSQAMDLLVGLKTCSGSSPYLLPGRYETDQPMSEATLNRVITVTVEKAQEQGLDLPHFCVHDLRRTASTLLHEAGYNTDWIEKALAHEQKGVRAVYNKAEYAEQRRSMLQSWADMVDGWVRGSKTMPMASRLAVEADSRKGFHLPA